MQHVFELYNLYNLSDFDDTFMFRGMEGWKLYAKKDIRLWKLFLGYFDILVVNGKTFWATWLESAILLIS